MNSLNLFHINYLPIIKSMKKFLLLLIILVESNLYGQTDSLEKIILLNKLISKEITDVDFSKIMPQWVQLINKVNYPDLPLDQNGQVHYVFINEFKGFDKEKLVNRTLEWLSINYGMLPSNMYSNLKEGKIILRNSLSLFNNYSCSFTSIFSIKDEKIKLELISLSYQTYYEGNYASGIPEKTISFNINEVYPIILKKPSEWKLNLSIFKATNKLFDTETKNLCDYILSYDNSNIF
jgi:hypothetical protein